MTTPTILALAALAIVVAGLAALAVFRKTLGHISITATSAKIEPGDRVEARVTLVAKRDLSWDRIVLALRCLDLDDRGGSLPYHEIYRDQVELSGPAELPAQGERTFTATFVVPLQLDSIGPAAAAPVALERLIEPFEEIAMRRRAMDIQWELVADAELGNLELTDTRRLDLDLLP